MPVYQLPFIIVLVCFFPILVFISYRNNTYWFPPHCTLDLHVHGRITERITLFPPLNCALHPFIDRPTIISLREVYTVNETGNVSMLCRADGLPKPTIIWRKKGSGEVLANGEQFHLLNAQSTDDGSYSCTSSNYLGEDTKEVMLNVQSKLFVWFVEPCTVIIERRENTKYSGFERV